MNRLKNKSIEKRNNHKTILWLHMCASPVFHRMFQTKLEDYYPARITIPVLQIVTHIHTAHIYSLEREKVISLIKWGHMWVSELSERNLLEPMTHGNQMLKLINHKITNKNAGNH